MQVEGKWVLRRLISAPNDHVFCVHLTNKEEKDHTNLIYLTAIPFHVNLLIKESRRRIEPSTNSQLGS